MHKTLVILMITFTILSFLEITTGGVIVNPLELSINMKDEFIHGNTSKKIIIDINENNSYNVSWYIEHPNPISWMRPNKTLIPDLSWIDLEPKWQIITPYNSADFYIHLSIPEREELLDQHWETWVTFKFDNIESGGLFKQEYAVRTYIDTPTETAIDNTSNHNSNEIEETKNTQTLIILIVVAIIVLIVTVIVIKKS